MMLQWERLFLILGCLCLVACATNQKSRWATTGAGFAVGAAIGASTAPRDERPELHALYWGGLVGLVSALVADISFSDQRDIGMMRLENEKLKSQLEFFQKGSATLLKETTGTADSKYFESGKVRIKLYRIDQWVDDGPNKKYHRDQMIEILPLETLGEK